MKPKYAFFIMGDKGNEDTILRICSILDKHNMSYYCPLKDEEEKEASENIEEEKAARDFILILPSSTSGYIEAGIAYALGKKCYGIGKQDSIEPTHYIFKETIEEDQLEDFIQRKKREKLEDMIESIYMRWNHPKVIEMNSQDEDTVKSREELLTLLDQLFEEVIKNENVDYDSVQKLGEGGFGEVYRIGDKVIKIGQRPREYKTYPNNPYIISPIFRKSIPIQGPKYKEGISIQIREYVDSVGEDEISEEDLYELYSKMRDIGLEWMDIFGSNVGRLRRDNVVHWQDDLEPVKEMIELDQKVGTDITLKAGDLVVLDDDFIYKEDEVPEDMLNRTEFEEYGFISTWKKFHKRYNEEHQKTSGYKI